MMNLAIKSFTGKKETQNKYKKNVCRLLFLLLMLTNISSFSINPIITAKVDERTELLSIVFKLAGNNEYNKGILLDYNKQIDNHFANFKDHEAIKYARKIHRKHYISYDAVMSLAIHLKIENSQLSIIDTIAENSIEKRWKPDVINTFVEKLNDFYTKSDFNKFFNSNRNLYNVAENRFEGVLQKLNIGWYDSFYGQSPKDGYNIILSLTNGPSNYGPKTISKSGQENTYAIIGSWQADSLNLPIYSSRNILPTIIHEFCHSFCNHLIDDHISEFEKSGKIIFPYVREKLKKQAYSSYQTMLYESLVRASVVKYVEQNDTNKTKVLVYIAREQGNGFLWTDKLFNKLTLYENNRDKYPTLEKFIPEIVSLFDSLAVDFNSYKNNFYSQCPKIESTSIKNNDVIDFNTKEITIVFDKPMRDAGYGFSYGKGGKNNFPPIDNVKWVNNKTLRLNVKLDKGRFYSLKLFTPAYIGENNSPVFDDFELRFKTSKN